MHTDFHDVVCVPFSYFHCAYSNLLFIGISQSQAAHKVRTICSPMVVTKGLQTVQDPVPTGLGSQKNCCLTSHVLPFHILSLFIMKYSVLVLCSHCDSHLLPLKQVNKAACIKSIPWAGLDLGMQILMGKPDDPKQFGVQTPGGWAQ